MYILLISVLYNRLYAPIVDKSTERGITVVVMIGAHNICIPIGTNGICLSEDLIRNTRHVRELYPSITRTYILYILFIYEYIYISTQARAVIQLSYFELSLGFDSRDTFSGVENSFGRPDVLLLMSFKTAFIIHYIILFRRYFPSVGSLVTNPSY